MATIGKKIEALTVLEHTFVTTIVVNKQIICKTNVGSPFRPASEFPIMLDSPVSLTPKNSVNVNKYFLNIT